MSCGTIQLPIKGLIYANLKRQTIKSSNRHLSATSDSGHIRDAGDKWKEREDTMENIYIKKMEHEQLKKLRKAYLEEISYHQKEIERHKEKMRDHEKALHKISEHGKED
ncbi:hypothetical protein GJ496_005580 [Pomphorhynchus laevis]|nr:hypothetical protein GJ496_005580 [Pomphorhynchus laevis]